MQASFPLWKLNQVQLSTSHERCSVTNVVCFGDFALIDRHNHATSSRVSMLMEKAHILTIQHLRQEADAEARDDSAKYHYLE